MSSQSFLICLQFQTGHGCYEIFIGRLEHLHMHTQVINSAARSTFWFICMVYCGHMMILGVYDLACLHMAHLTILAVQFVK